MFIVVYRWRLKPRCEETFREGWRRVTKGLREHRGSLGSRLHRCEDGTWVAYAQWPSEERFAESSARGPLPEEPGYAMMKESIEPNEQGSTFLRMEVSDDLLSSPTI